MPGLRAVAPVNAPFSWPKSSVSSSVLGNGRAVDGDERAVPPRAERVQRPREQLLAGAALAFEQHGGVGGGRAVQCCEHLRAARVFADDPRRAAALGQFLLEQRVLGEQAALREGALDHQQQVIGVDRLGQEVHAPSFIASTASWMLP